MSDPARYTDGSTDDLSEDLDVIADALAAPGGTMRATCESCAYSWVVDNEDEAGACENCDSDDVTVE